MTATLPESPVQSYGDAFPNSTKVYVEGSRGIRVPMREIASLRRRAAAPGVRHQRTAWR